MTRRPRRPSVDAIDALYARIPAIECRGKCQQACGPIDMSSAERRRLARHGVTIPPPLVQMLRARDVPSCPALTMLGTCGAYALRPAVCRLWGVVEAMPCPFGCRPAGGWLPEVEARAILAELDALEER